MPTYVLNYFPIGGRALAARLMFKIAGVEFTDNHIAGEEWAKAKENTSKFPLKQMPTLEVDGKVICQSAAIYRYLANEFNLYGSSNMDRVLVDQVCETLSEILAEIVKILFSQDSAEEKAEKMKEAYSSDSVKLKYGFIANILKDSGGKFLIGEKISVADIVFFSAHDMVLKTYPNVLDQFDDLKALNQRVADQEQVKSYLESLKS